MASLLERDAEAISLCESAFHTEQKGQISLACEIHAQAITALQSVREELSGARKTPDDRMVLTISREEIWLNDNEAESDPKTMAHLLQPPIPHFASTLNRKTPSTTFSITFDPKVFRSGLYLKVKSGGAGSQMLYLFEPFSGRTGEPERGILRRSAEFTKTCVEMDIKPLTGVNVTAAQRTFQGRPLTVRHAMLGRSIVEIPDRYEKRPDKADWWPRRFTYGGRQFVWVTEPDGESAPQTLYEARDVRPKPGSKTGKMVHQIVSPRVAWGYGEVLHVASEVDQVFREYILAVQLTRMAIIYLGRHAMRIPAP